MTNARTRGATACRAALALGGGLMLGSAAVPAAAQARPNIVMFLVDDATASLTGRMPNVKQLIINRGATFTPSNYPHLRDAALGLR